MEEMDDDDEGTIVYLYLQYRENIGPKYCEKGMGLIISQVWLGPCWNWLLEWFFFYLVRVAANGYVVALTDHSICDNGWVGTTTTSEETPNSDILLGKTVFSLVSNSSNS